MFVSYNPSGTDSIPSSTDPGELSGVTELALFVDRFTANTDAGQAVGGFEDTATSHTGLVEEAGRVAHPKMVGACLVSGFTRRHREGLMVLGSSLWFRRMAGG
jgi:hypothetical protein